MFCWVTTILFHIAYASMRKCGHKRGIYSKFARELMGKQTLTMLSASNKWTLGHDLTFFKFVISRQFAAMPDTLFSDSCHWSRTLDTRYQTQAKDQTYEFYMYFMLLLMLSHWFHVSFLVIQFIRLYVQY